MSPKSTVREWRIRLVHAKGQYLGRIEATAIKVASEPFGDHRRAAATPIRRGV